MPTYEMALLLKNMPRQEIVSTLKRTANAIFEHKGVIKKMNYLGLKPTPHKISANGSVHHQANYFVLHFSVGPRVLVELEEGYNRDVDIIRKTIFRLNTDVHEQPECTLHEELKPPVYRKSVQEMMAVAARKIKPKYPQHTGLDYYPFQK